MTAPASGMAVPGAAALLLLLLGAAAAAAGCGYQVGPGSRGRGAGATGRGWGGTGGGWGAPERPAETGTGGTGRV